MYNGMWLYNYKDTPIEKLFKQSLFPLIMVYDFEGLLLSPIFDED